MSTEKTRDFLEMQGEELAGFKPVLLRTTVYDSEGKQMDLALAAIAEHALALKCKYVVNIQTQGYNSQQSKGASGSFFFFGQEGSYNAGIILTGTGLVPKGE